MPIYTFVFKSSTVSDFITVNSTVPFCFSLLLCRTGVVALPLLSNFRLRPDAAINDEEGAASSALTSLLLPSSSLGLVLSVVFRIRSLMVDCDESLYTEMVYHFNWRKTTRTQVLHVNVPLRPTCLAHHRIRVNMQ
jgi:hypothetical protein